jgi:hypothetical protein
MCGASAMAELMAEKIPTAQHYVLPDKCSVLGYNAAGLIGAALRLPVSVMTIRHAYDGSGGVKASKVAAPYRFILAEERELTIELLAIAWHEHAPTCCRW